MINWVPILKCLPNLRVVVLDNSLQLLKLRIVIDEERVYGQKTELFEVDCMGGIPLGESNGLVDPVGLRASFHTVTIIYSNEEKITKVKRH